MKIERERFLARTLSELSVTILSLLREHARLTIGELQTLTEANRNTLKLRLRELVAARHIAQHGRAKATWYTLNSTR